MPCFCHHEQISSPLVIHAPRSEQHCRIFSYTPASAPSKVVLCQRIVSTPWHVTTVSISRDASS